MTDTNKIVAAIFAAAMRSKVTADPAEYLKVYDDSLKEA